jgi:hypothetical protein
MAQMPETRAQLAFDVVGSSAHDDDLLPNVRSASEQLLRAAFDSVNLDFDARTNVSAAGDGDLMSFPESFLPGLIDMTQHLQKQLYDHNRKTKPEIPMRLSVHAGPLEVTDAPSFQRSYIELSRMLESAALKEVVRRCQEAGPYSLALILSDQAYRTAVRARRTTDLVPHHFAAIEISGKSFEERCWIHVPSVDAARITEYAATDAPKGDDPKLAGGKRDSSGTLAGANVIGNAIAGDSHGTTIANFGTWQGHP